MTPEVEEMVIEALARNMTHVAAASEIGISSKAVQRLLGRSDFMSRLGERRAMKVVDYAGSLDSIEDLALSTIRDAMAPGEKMSDRLHAVDCWARQRSNVRGALNVDARLLALEADRTGTGIEDVRGPDNEGQAS